MKFGTIYVGEAPRVWVVRTKTCGWARFCRVIYRLIAGEILL